MGQRSQSVPSSPNHAYKCARCGKVKPSNCFFTYKRLGQTTSDSVCSSCRTLFNRRHGNRLLHDDFITTNRLFDNVATSSPSAFCSYKKESTVPNPSVISISPETLSSVNSINSSMNSSITSANAYQPVQEPPPPACQPIQTQLPPQIETSSNDVNYFNNYMSIPSPILSMNNLYNSLNITPLVSPTTSNSSPVSTISTSNSTHSNPTLEQLHIQLLQQRLLLEQQNNNNNTNIYSPINTLNTSSFFCNNNNNNLIDNSNIHNTNSRMILNPIQQQQQRLRSNSNTNNSSLQLRNYSNIDTTAITTTTPISSSSSRRKVKSKKNQEIDFRISYENLRKLVTIDVYNGLRKDKFNELVIYSNNATDIVTQIPDEKLRTNIMLNEITIFYHISSEEVCCKSCGKKIAQIECFIHENYVICKDCSLKVDIRDLSDWEYTGKRPIQLQCVRCKHIIPYHKFLKYNRKDEIKRQNTCSYCRLKQWIDYYRS